MVAAQRGFDAERGRGAEAQVNVIPEDRGVAARGGRRAGHDARVRVALDDLEARPERRAVERVRQLAQAAARVRDDAALAQLAPAHVAAPAARPPDVRPEAEDRAGGHFDAVEPPRGET